jgi:hypothetical protein
MAYIADISVVRAASEVKAAEQRHYGESKECVAAVKHFCNAPQTSRWSKGIQVKGNAASIKAGTAIATFDSNGHYKGHAAIYDGQNNIGLTVHDQWGGNNSQPLHKRVIQFKGKGYVSNDGDQFYVIE